MMLTNNEETPLDFRAILLGDEPVAVARLYQLSDLMPDDLEIFYEIWPELDDERRRIIVRHLTDISEQHYQVDFSDIFAFCLVDPSPPVRIAALDGLWDSERVLLIKPILDLAQNDPDLEVRRLATATLGHYVLLGEWDQIPRRYTEPVIEKLLVMLEDDGCNPSVKRAALESVSSAAHTKIASLIEQAYDSANSEMQVSAIFAMGQSADPRWLPIVMDETQSPYEEMRIEAARAAGAIGSSEAVPEVAELVTDEDMEVRLAAIAALGEIGGGHSKQVLMNLMEDPYLEDQHPAIEEAMEAISWLDLDFDIDSLRWDNDPDS